MVWFRCLGFFNFYIIDDFDSNQEFGLNFTNSSPNQLNGINYVPK